MSNEVEQNSNEELNNSVAVLNPVKPTSPFVKVGFALFLLAAIAVVAYFTTKDDKVAPVAKEISTDVTFGQGDETPKDSTPKINTWDIPLPPDKSDSKGSPSNQDKIVDDTPPPRPKPVIVINKSKPLAPARNTAQSPPSSLSASSSIDKELNRYLDQLGANAPTGQNPNRSETLQGRLDHQGTAVSVASLLPNRDFLLTKGTYLDCVLRSKINSTVPGMTSCYLTKDVYSDNGVTRLLEKGSEVSGEYQANIKQGQARLFVLWDRVKTPYGVVVNLASPASSPLGEGGLGGHVDNHFWQRFGGAMMLSLVDDFVGFASTGNDFDNTTGTAQDMAAEALKSTINIAPTFSKNQGARVGIYIARDIDFSKVYQLEVSSK